MNIDFSALRSLASKGEDPAEDFKHSEPLITIDYSKAYKTPPAPARGPKQLKLIHTSTTTQNSPTGEAEGLEIIEEEGPIKTAQRSFEKEDGSHLKSLISKGIAKGEDTINILLKAIECISILSEDKAYYERNRERMALVYGAGLEKKAALELELVDISARINRLKYSLSKDSLTANEREGIEEAIRENREREEEIKAMI